MSWKQCPLCYGPLQSRDVAPCDECGGDPKELEHFRSGQHTYHLLRVIADFELTLCNFCMVDFGSFDPVFLGLPRGSKIGFERMQLVRDISNPSIGHDKFCAACGYRLAFLKFVASVRQTHAVKRTT